MARVFVPIFGSSGDFIPTGGGGGGGGISEDFVSISEWNGTTSVASVATGALKFTGEGFIMHSTDLGTGDKWMRFKVVAMPASGGSTGFALGDSSGNLIGWIFDRIAIGDLAIDNSTDYSTYNSWNADTANFMAGTFVAGQFVGVTFEMATHTVRMWTNVSAATPDSVSSWDTRGANATSTTMTFKANSTRIGFGNFSSSADAVSTYDDLTANHF